MNRTLGIRTSTPTSTSNAEKERCRGRHSKFDPVLSGRRHSPTMVQSNQQESYPTFGLGVCTWP